MKTASRCIREAAVFLQRAFEMSEPTVSGLPDTGERMLPPTEGETSVVFARQKYTYELVKDFVRAKTVLDIGCGSGYGCKILAESALSVVGVDRDPRAIAYCREHSAAPNLTFLEGEAGRLTFDRKFDVCLSFQMIEHLTSPADFIQEMKRWTNPGGQLLISTPNSRVGLHGKPDNPFHVSEMTYEEFRRLIEGSFRNWKIIGIGYTSKSKMRQFVFDSPLYAVGRLLKRKSRVKRVASGFLGLSSFRIVESNVAEESIDLLAICVNE